LRAAPTARDPEEAALLLERRDLTLQLGLLVDDRPHVRQGGGEERPDLAAHGVASRRELPGIEREAHHHQHDRDRRQDPRPREAAPERLALAVVGELAAPEVHAERRALARLPQRQAERRRERRLLAPERHRHGRERQRVERLRGRPERPPERRERARGLDGLAADPERGERSTIGERQEGPAHLAETALDVAAVRDPLAHDPQAREPAVGEERHRRPLRIEPDECDAPAAALRALAHHVQRRQAPEVDEPRIDPGGRERGEMIAHRGLRRRHGEHVTRAVVVRAEDLEVDDGVVELEGQVCLELEGHRLLETLPVVKRQREDAVRDQVAGKHGHDLVPHDAVVRGERAQIAGEIAARRARVGVEAEDALGPQGALHQRGPERMRAHIEGERVIGHPISGRRESATWRENRKG
jgi:hypothetical protein